MSEKYDVIIVGGGPIGGTVGNIIAKKNFKVAIFEKNKEIGKPLRCAGLVSEKTFKHTPISKSNLVQNKIKGANIHSPSDNVLTIGGDKIHALAIDRVDFDKKIINQSEKNGAKVFLEHKIASTQRQKKHVEVTSEDKKSYIGSMLIGADGPHSIVRDRFSFPEPVEFLNGMGAEITDTSLDPDFVEIFVGNKIAPGFFAWIIPINRDGTRARVGLCVEHKSAKNLKKCFKIFLENKKVSQLLDKQNIEQKIAGVIPLGPLKKTYSENILLVGDAAAQVKPTSGGGLYPGLLCANHCANVTIEALEKQIFSTSLLKKYHKKWYKEIGRELYMGRKFRRVFSKLSDQQMDKYLKKFQNKKIRDVINQYGDIDHPSKLLKPLIKKTPSLLKLLPTSL